MITDDDDCLRRLELFNNAGVYPIAVAPGNSVLNKCGAVAQTSAVFLSTSVFR